MADAENKPDNANTATTDKGAEKSNGASDKQVEPIALNTLGQYVKDLSFENPRAPLSLQGQAMKPEINIAVNVNAAPIGETEYEVSLHLEARAKTPEGILFNVDLLYAGIFRITGIAKENIHPIILIECPRLLFPFARQIVADCTRDGGFPPLMIDPVDFAGLYRQRLAEAQAVPDKDKN